MLAGQAVGADTVEAHIRENPEAAKRGIGIIAESLMTFVQECIRLGVDGFYHSTQGGEASRLGGSRLFEECVKPFDLLLICGEIDRSCVFNILHICDYHAGYDDLTPFLDLRRPRGQLQPAPRRPDADAAGGLRDVRPAVHGRAGTPGDRATGTPDEVVRAAAEVLHHASDRFILGADPSRYPGTPTGTTCGPRSRPRTTGCRWYDICARNTRPPGLSDQSPSQEKPGFWQKPGF